MGPSHETEASLSYLDMFNHTRKEVCLLTTRIATIQCDRSPTHAELEKDILIGR